MPLSNGRWGLQLQPSLAPEGPHLPQTWHLQNRAATREQGGNSGGCCIGDCLPCGARSCRPGSRSASGLRCTHDQLICHCCRDTGVYLGCCQLMPGHMVQPYALDPSFPMHHSLHVGDAMSAAAPYRRAVRLPAILRRRCSRRWRRPAAPGVRARDRRRAPGGGAGGAQSPAGGRSGESPAALHDFLSVTERLSPRLSRV